MAEARPGPAGTAGTALGALEEQARLARALLAALEERFLGQHAVAELLVAALFAGGHVLLEGAPGLGKTRLVRSLAALLALDYGRIQCTPDLLPGDITGTEILAPGGADFRFAPGPVFCQVFLADEINRATPRTQSALLEAMEERQVTSARVAHPLPRPFFVAATQNPVELEGTYPLPEAQLDRFLFKLEIASPETAVLESILALPAPAREAPLQPILECAQVLALQDLASGLPVPAGFTRRVAEIVRASHPEAPEAPDAIREHVRWGASPRAGRAALSGARALALLRGRAHVAPQDLQDALVPALRHRVLLRYEAQAAGLAADCLIAGLLDRYPIE